MLTEEPYRWLEAIQNRRQYIDDQLETGMPVVAMSGMPGILIMTIKASTPKIFEIYDHLALGYLGHPADLEKVRQAAIDTAHLEGFTRSRQDVGSRRLVNYSLAPALKTAFEQIFSGPLMFRGILAELDVKQEKDSLWLMDYDGSYQAATQQELVEGVLVTGRKSLQKEWSETTQGKSADQKQTWAELAKASFRLLAWAIQPADISHRVPWNQFKDETAGGTKGTRPDQLEVSILNRALLPDGIAYQSTSLVKLQEAQGASMIGCN